MKAKLILISIVFSVSNIFAQTDSLTFQKDIETLNNKVVSLENSIGKLQKTKNIQVTEFEFIKSQIDTIRTSNSEILKENTSLKNSQSALKKDYQKLNNSFGNFKENAEKKIDSLQQIININSANIKKTADELGVKIEDNHQFTNQSITDLYKTVRQNTLYWIIAILIVAILVLLVFVLLKKQIFKQKTDLDSNIQDTRKSIDKEIIKLDEKLISLFETQLKTKSEQPKKENNDIDHSLALRVADEIIRIRKNMSRMDEKTKGLKQLTKSVERIQNEFAANGYEIVEMLGKPYDDRIIASANFIPDDNLEKGERIITRIIKPQVNYKGVMKQSAQIEVSQGE